MGLLTYLLQRQDLQQQREAEAQAAEAQRESNLSAARSLLGRYGTETAGQIGPALLSENPALRQAGLGLLDQLQAPEALSEYQRAQIASWQRDAQMEAERMALARAQMALRERELTQSREFRQQTVDQGWERLGQGRRATPQQGSQLATAFNAVENIRRLINTARPEFFGFVSDNLGDAALEYKQRFGTDEDLTTWWNLKDNYEIEINRSRMSGMLTDQDMRILHEAWPRRSNDPKVAFNALGNILTILEAKALVAEEAIRYSGRIPSELPAALPSEIPPPPPGFELRP